MGSAAEPASAAPTPLSHAGPPGGGTLTWSLPMQSDRPLAGDGLRAAGTHTVGEGARPMGGQWVALCSPTKGPFLRNGPPIPPQHVCVRHLPEDGPSPGREPLLDGGQSPAPSASHAAQRAASQACGLNPGIFLNKGL